jgi:hypothetical protein
MASENVKPGEKAEVKACPRCGWQEVDKPKPNPDDVKEFFRSVMGDRPYRKTYPLAGGQLVLTFSTMTAEETDVVNHFIVAAQVASDIELAEIGIKTKMVYTLKEVRSGDAVKKFEAPNFTRETPLEDLLKEYRTRLAGIDDTKLRMYCRTMMLFNDLVQLLIGEAFDENFWKAAGPF